VIVDLAREDGTRVTEMREKVAGMLGGCF